MIWFSILAQTKHQNGNKNLYLDYFSIVSIGIENS